VDITKEIAKDRRPRRFQLPANLALWLHAYQPAPGKCRMGSADIGDAQDERTGAITDTAPFNGGGMPADPVSVAYLLIPSLLFQHYGDTRVIERNCEGMRRWVDYLTSRSTKNIVHYSFWGDWAPPAKEGTPSWTGAVSKNTPGELVSTAYYYFAAKLYSQIAAEIGRTADASAYKTLAQEIQVAFHREFWKPALNGYGSGNQACNAIALYLDLVPAELRSKVVTSLVQAVEQADYHLTTGNLCTKYLLEVLSAEGHGTVALKIATQHSYPSWGYMLDNGATTVWERWELATGPGMNSHNHPMNGSVGAWLYRWVAGLALGEPRRGQPHILFQPPVLDGVSQAQAELPTLCGPASISWKRENQAMRITVRVPWNCTATVRLPGARDQEISAGEYDYTIKL
jgi:alpha-L-rhamnosidase